MSYKLLVIGHSRAAAVRYLKGLLSEKAGIDGTALSGVKLAGKQTSLVVQRADMQRMS